MIESIINWFRRHQVESLADYIVVGITWTAIPVLSGILVSLLATLAGHIVGCL